MAATVQLLLILLDVMAVQPPTARASRRGFLGASTAACAMSRAVPCAADLRDRLGDGGGDAVRIQPPAGVVPFGDQREYVALRLPNGARALLVHDVEATRAEVALAIAGAGQFSDPPDTPGLAHLTEHMVLAADGHVNEDGDGELEAWLAARDGASNAFTALELVCFHLSVAHDSLEPALRRFLALFARPPPLAGSALSREIERVHAELSAPSDGLREFYLLKALAQPDHPFSRFGAGDRRTLGGSAAREVEVRARVLAFWAERYVAERTVLVIVAPAPMRQLRAWAASALGAVPAGRRPPAALPAWAAQPAFAPSALGGREFLIEPRDDGPTRRLGVWWPLRAQQGTATAVVFVLAQLLLGRTGAGSLRAALAARGWLAPEAGGAPRLLLAVDAAGARVACLTLGLSARGLRERRQVLRAVRAAAALLGAHGGPSRALVAECASIARIHSWALAPRPPDALELAVDAHGGYGLGANHVTGAGALVPTAAPSAPRGDARVLDRSRAAVCDALCTLADPRGAIVFASARGLATRARVATEPVLGARYVERTLPPAAAVRPADALALGLTLPQRNPLVPLRLRPARPRARGAAGASAPAAAAGVRGRWREALGQWREALVPSAAAAAAAAPDGAGAGARAPGAPLLRAERRGRVCLLDAAGGGAALPLPRAPRASAQAALVVQLLTRRPSGASAAEAAHAELWLLELHERARQLAELGAVAGLKYEASFNAHGVRFAFTGLSQSLGEYTARFAALLGEHALGSSGGGGALPVGAALAELERARAPRVAERRAAVRAALVAARRADVRVEGAALWRSVSGTLVVAQGDVLPAEALALADGFAAAARVPAPASAPPAWPPLRAVLYAPRWRPTRTGDACLLPGVPLVADACGRLLR
ncbi:hypothetical protein KFE25_014436 [Diacronema lutheri]|uniref:Peptidase M16 N-terminal domain-containing protein n=2 Tax=Diacronema lutheri TaxID=2081491 RepID=A0A8J5X5I1_DIALT|nr:hypothetical protein KFE25_014436 [Diacronema lutheri]